MIQIDANNIQNIATLSRQTDAIVLNEYESDEVVYVDDGNIGTLKRDGYILDGIDIRQGHTYVLHRKNCILHAVRPMQTLREIASMYTKSPETIMQDNDLKTSKLYIGQILVIY